ncbi:hypothetical protein CLV51_103160 [Chitinophaga niastensis]|uniref:DUF481 domain-containing protein n=1 Tax=Chitinophaga niastensis TaxID=536980 RepID=A0A2P8HIY2_CHINA|nr:hypothetical protein [Chitinophaga niastensis]PSL46184.1 hypothetical protein CLV51_103160 [Chitinophaga niastensis]
MRAFYLFLLLLTTINISLYAQQAGSTAIDTVTPMQDANNQAPADSTRPRVRSHFTAGVQYLSDNVYTGRKDSSHIPYLTTTVAYYHKSGLYAEGAVSMLSGTDNMRVDAGILSAGYLFSRGNFDGDISASKYFYNNLSQNVRAEVKGDIRASGSYDFNEIITATVDGNLTFSSKNDYALRGALDHIFYLLQDRLRINPTLSANAGTQHYYDAYYNFRHLSHPHSKKDKAKPTVIADMQQASQFNILDYEFSMPVSYTIHRHLTLSFEPIYAMPVHPAVLILTTVASNTSKTRTEPLSNQFYWSFGVTYKW